MKPFEWQVIWENQDGPIPPDHYECTYRAKVPGGYLVRHEVSYLYDYPDGDKGPLEEGWSKRINTMIFLPDTTYCWDDL